MKQTKNTGIVTAHFVILLANSNLFKSSQGVDKGDYLEYVRLCFSFRMTIYYLVLQFLCVITQIMLVTALSSTFYALDSA